MHELLAELRRKYDVVLLDTPPLLAVSDAIPLMSLVDVTVLVCRVGKSTTDDAERLMNLARRVPDARVAGLVVNDVDEAEGERYPGY
jgi:Mrp family chromosome partitioning ATPase